MAPKITTVNRLEDVSFIEAGLDLISGRKPPDAVAHRIPGSRLARAETSCPPWTGTLEGRVAGLRCWDVDLLSVFSARAAIVLAVGGWEEKQEHSCYCSLETSYAEFSRVVDGVTKVCKTQSCADCSSVMRQLPAVFFSSAQVLVVCRSKASVSMYPS